MHLKNKILILILSAMSSLGFGQHKQEINSGWQFAEKGTNNWYMAQVPGCVHTDLLLNKLIDEPFYRNNERNLQWIDKKDWVYKTIFRVSAQTMQCSSIELLFEGLDTYAKVYVNDSLVLTANNMFRSWRIAVKRLLHEGDNRLLIEFESPITKHAKDWEALGFEYPAVNDQSENGGVGTQKLSVFARKAGYQYGWDWGPRFVTSGVWRSVRLLAWDACKVVNNTIVQHAVSAQSASIEVSSTVRGSMNGHGQQRVLLNGVVVKETEFEFSTTEQKIKTEFTIANPRLWWCNGLGEAYLYSVTTEVVVNKTVISREEKKLGVRSIRHICKKDEHGQSFCFELNGVPVFMKGANYIPIDNFPSRVSAERYEEVVGSAVDANMNMLRVWGGGIYENDLFYDLCDRYGILVWQDFMFACSLYPSDDQFLANVKQEVIENICRLRHHASLAVWCGNNEIHTAWHTWGWKEKFEKQSPELAKQLWHGYDTLFNKLLAQTVAEQSPEIPYWPSSPMATAEGGVANNFAQGDVHYWEVWHAEKPFEEYLSHVGRFVSEYGFQSFPERSTVDRYTIASDRDIESDVMLAHQRHPRGNQLIKKYLSYYYRTPKSFDKFLYVGQVLQAEGIKMAIEAHRRAKPYCMGTLYWQLNDCWPVASWSSTDYYGRWKAEHYFNRAAYSNILVSPIADNKTVAVHVVNDALTDSAVIVDLKTMTFDGRLLWSKQISFTAKANSAAVVLNMANEDILQQNDIHNCLLLCQVKALNGQEIARNVLYFSAVKDLTLPHPQITQRSEMSNGKQLLFLKTDVLAKNVYISGSSNEHFSDNYFDLLPGEEKCVEIMNTKGGQQFMVTSLVDSY